MADDDVTLTDLVVIQKFSLAVRGATASRAHVVAALESDLAYLTGRSTVPKAAPAEQATPTKASAKAVAKAPAKAPVKRAAKAPGKVTARPSNRA